MVYIDEEVNNLPPTGTTWRFKVLQLRYEQLAKAELLGNPNETFTYGKELQFNPTNKHKRMSLSLSDSADTLTDNKSYRSKQHSISMKSGSINTHSVPLFKPRHTGTLTEVLPSA
jgi:hypothetical protein